MNFRLVAAEALPNGPERGPFNDSADIGVGDVDLKAEGLGEFLVNKDLNAGVGVVGHGIQRRLDGRALQLVLSLLDAGDLQRRGFQVCTELRKVDVGGGRRHHKPELPIGVSEQVRLRPDGVRQIPRGLDDFFIERIFTGSLLCGDRGAIQHVVRDVIDLEELGRRIPAGDARLRYHFFRDGSG